jgi:hypothetical protein
MRKFSSFRATFMIEMMKSTFIQNVN